MDEMDAMEQSAFNLVIKVENLSWREIEKALEILAQQQITGVGLGKQSVSKLLKQGAPLTQIPIEANGISDFESVARKYGIDFSIVKNGHEVDASGKAQSPTYSVFFRSKDADVMNAAFKEYVGIHLGEKTKKPSVLDKLHKAIKEVAQQTPDKVKNRHQERGER